MSPLRGGCPGGRGGIGTNAGGLGGGGGGALQVSAAGNLILMGSLSAGGGGGLMGAGAGDGGGGGGSGGAILLEGDKLVIDSKAIVAANGGGGGGGQPTSRASFDSTAGGNGSANLTAATGGNGSNSGGAGGLGGFGGGAAGEGEDGVIALEMGGGGGGGGGAAGRIRINHASDCVRGEYSPQPSVDCPSCAGVCPSVPAAPADGCVLRSRGAATYFVCDGPETYEAARDICRAAGLELVHIDDKAENDWIVLQIADAPTWFGGSDYPTEGDWYWIDDDVSFWSGTSTGGAVGGAFTDWAFGEPNGSGDCGRFEPDGWHDQGCTLTSAYVCER